MNPNLDPKPKPEPHATDSENPSDAALPDATSAEAERQKQLWEDYRLQQRRRSCPGCGDDGGVL